MTIMFLAIFFGFYCIATKNIAPINKRINKQTNTIVFYSII